MLFKNISKAKLKEGAISSGTRTTTTTKTTSQAPGSSLYLEGWTKYFRHFKLSKNKMDSKVIKLHQHVLERFQSPSIKLNSESNQNVTLFRKKQV